MDWLPGSHASTFGGNPVACSAAIETLRLVENGYRANAHDRGEQLRAGLRSLADRHSFVKDVRGLGLMVGMEVGSDDGPDPDLRDQIIELAFRQGLLLLPCGPSTVRFCPPLCLTSRQVDMGLELLALALDQIETATPAPTV